MMNGRGSAGASWLVDALLVQGDGQCARERSALSGSGLIRYFAFLGCAFVALVLMELIGDLGWQDSRLYFREDINMWIGSGTE